MIEDDPLERDRVERRLRLRRDSRREALRLNAAERDRIERELRELDDAIVGIDHLEAARLREWSERLDAAEEEREQRMLDGELDKTFPASDTPGHLAPGSQASEP